MSPSRASLTLVLLVAAAGCIVKPIPPRATPQFATQALGQPGSDSTGRMLADIRALSGIGAHRGWRTAGSPGEAQAFDYVAAQLEDLAGSPLSVEVNRQSYRLPVGSHIHTSQLWLDVGQGEVQVPADSICCSRRADTRALFFDSDGQAGDDQPDPVDVAGIPRLAATAGDIASLHNAVALVDFALVDTYVQGTEAASRNATALLGTHPSAIVLITRFSNKVGESHGTQAAVGSIFSRVANDPWPPILYARMEDFAQAGVASWEDLTKLRSVRLTWDADISIPGQSANLIARIPGQDGKHAIILGAMIDSSNVPGAMDDAAGVSVLLEVARRLAVGGTRPPHDVYLVWFGAEEVGLVGSSYFAATHQDLLDQTLAVLTVDCLGSPLDGLRPQLTFGSWPYGVAGEMQMPWVESLIRFSEKAGHRAAASFSGGGSDNMAFVAYDVPNANLIYMDEEAMNALGGIHYAIHIHDPYDEPALAERESGTLADMLEVALAAATGQIADLDSLRVSPRSVGKALLVGSHTEAMDLPMTVLTSFGIVLAMQGLDVDLLPYGEPVTPEALRDADMAILLPVMDYPVAGLGPQPYDEGWRPDEVEALSAYVERGGLMVVAGSRYQLGWSNTLWDANEDWADINVVAQRFGIEFGQGALAAPVAIVAQGSFPLGVGSLEDAEGNGMPILAPRGEVLARSGDEAAVVYVPVGNAGGAVLALSDLGMLGSYSYDPRNVPFWNWLAMLAIDR
jgi:Peptidase family M28